MTARVKVFNEILGILYSELAAAQLEDERVKDDMPFLFNLMSVAKLSELKEIIMLLERARDGLPYDDETRFKEKWWDITA